MYVCMPADHDSIRHTQRVVAAELRLQHCPPEQIADTQRVVADLLGPLCQAEDVRQYGLTIQQSPTTPGAVRVSVNTGDTNLQREIPIPRPRPPTDDIQGL
ncbi:hypothetical protein OHU11_00765 [Streptomyces sp. NBC_00257]|uniref:hypothetical protein n=2 Tax=Streptomyces TaxID=1883 RepID=UPI002258DB5A|nr:MULTISPECIES: hypothetical protein [unclassified Streptomyces]WSW10282.1 hypothetical protein OG298_41445 [Streptomyces sp. NBC_01005]WTB59422.1 hypothetical protein OG832_43185 [Streptomyces sp. NBC_00826]WTH87707.1 hypothetical protein OIC43_00535 [Streptomyces sp. NBC_00825]MCX4869896.1 hypothetical protein [Streptomyces sp. NBC_00906]MCX4901059.1 hypothetical protein [Streptomyces sp. NBC_00892]